MIVHCANVREASHQMLSEGALLAAMNMLTGHSTGQEEVQTTIVSKPTLQFEAHLFVVHSLPLICDNLDLSGLSSRSFSTNQVFLKSLVPGGDYLMDGKL